MSTPSQRRRAGGSYYNSRAPRKVPDMAIGSDVWPGLAKLAEECGELQQVIGKIMAYPDGEHPDGAGDLAQRLQDEMADVVAAVRFVATNSDRISLHDIRDRIADKFGRFIEWHASS
jgi:NTP pyrophosphatase (non-canonical NTP hydrolase)